VVGAVLYCAGCAVYWCIPPLRSAQNTQIFLACCTAHSLLSLWLMSAVCTATKQPHHDERLAGLLERAEFWLCMLVVPRLLILPMMPWLSDDVYRYIWDGTLLLEGHNPYAIAPQMLAGTAAVAKHRVLFDLLDYKYLSTLYPPFAQWCFVVSVWIGQHIGQEWQYGYFAWKMLIGVAECGGVWCVAAWFIRQRYSLGGLAWYVLLPLPIIEGVGQGHLDGLLVLPLGALVLLVGNRHLAGSSTTLGLTNGLPSLSSTALIGICTAVAGCIKILPFAVMLPLMRALQHWRQWLVLLLSAALTTGVMAWSFFADDARAGQAFIEVIRITSSFQFNGGLYYAWCYIQHWLEVPSYWLYASSQMGVLRVLGVAAVGTLPRWKAENLVKGMTWALAAAVLIAPKVHTWYFIGLLLLNTVTQYRWMVVLAMGSMMSYAFYAVEPFQERYNLEIALWMIAGIIAIWETGLLQKGQRTSPKREKKFDNEKKTL